jgi:hypothetical protein
MAFEKSCFYNEQRMLRLGSVRGEVGQIQTELYHGSKIVSKPVLGG